MASITARQNHEYYLASIFLMFNNYKWLGAAVLTARVWHNTSRKIYLKLQCLCQESQYPKPNDKTVGTNLQKHMYSLKY